MAVVIHGRFEVLNQEFKLLLQHHRRVNTGQHHTEYITANAPKLKVVIKQPLQTVSNFQQELITYFYAKAGRHV